MGKASRWFRSLLGLKKSTDQTPPPPPPSTVTHTDLKPSKERRKWSFGKSYREKDHRHQNYSTRPTTTTATSTSTSTAAGDNRRGGQYGDASVPPSVSSSGYVDGGVDQNKHAIAVAAATAAVAEAAVAAAQAAAAVVRLTSSGRCNSSSTAYVSSSCSVVGVRDEWAALKIQSAFRGYLAKRALRALKGLVKLQALVRGHIVRKRTEDTWRRMQVLLRAQARACAGRAIVSESPLSSSKSSHYHYTGPATPEKFEHAVRAKSTRHNQPSTLKRNGSKSNSRVFNDKSHLSWNCSDQQIDEGLWEQHGSTRTGLIDDEKSDKILEIDTGKPHFTPKRRNLLHSHHHALDSDQNSHSFTTSKDSTTRQTVPSQSSCEVQSLSPLKFSHEVEEGPFCTAENSPQFYSASSRGGSSRRGPFTPTNSDGSRSYLSGYSDHPNYMAYTQSSKAKLRSSSAPKQRPHFDRSSSAKRYSVHGFGDLRSSSHKASSTLLHANFTSKAYPGSGRLDRLGMPVRGDQIGSAGGFYNKC